MCISAREWFVCAVVGLASLAYLAPAKPVAPQVLSVYFSPHGGCTAAIVAILDDARQNVDVQAYAFTSLPIARNKGRF
jgi:hypothetical protein